MKTCPASRGDEYSSGNKTLGLECEMSFQFSLKVMQAVLKERDKAVTTFKFKKLYTALFIFLVDK